MKKNVPTGQVFYLHTEPFEKGFQQFGDRATIAIQRVGNALFWGLAICTAGDNFSKAKGRDLASQRLREGFGIVKDTGFFKDFETESQLLITTAANLGNKVERNYNRWKHRLNEFAEMNAATAEALEEVQPNT